MALIMWNNCYSLKINDAAYESFNQSRQGGVSTHLSGYAVY